MKKMNNKVHLEGRLYQHSLEKKVTGPQSKKPGTEYIQGNIEIATDEDITNIVSVHFSYITEVTSTGKTDSRFKVLSDIIDGKYLTCIADGADVASKLSVDTSIGVNDFYTDRQVDDNGDPTLVTAKRNEGGFVRVVNNLKEADKDRNYFNVDIVITGFVRKEADEDRGLPEKGIIKGAIFDFRNALLPVEFSVTNPKAIDYFEGLEASSKNPVFTAIKGTQISEVVKKTITVEGAFGDEVREVENNRKDWVIYWAQQDPYDFDTAETITKAELTKAMTDRQTMLAEVKQRYMDYKASAAPAKTVATAAAGEDFSF